MLITFGLLLDGEHGWHPANRLGMPVLGPLGLLNPLETRLGLLRPDCAHAQRVTAHCPSGSSSSNNSANSSCIGIR